VTKENTRGEGKRAGRDQEKKQVRNHRKDSALNDQVISFLEKKKRGGFSSEIRGKASRAWGNKLRPRKRTVGRTAACRREDGEGGEGQKGTLKKRCWGKGDGKVTKKAVVGQGRGWGEGRTE